MFETTEDPRFVILERMGQGQQAFATWRFEFRLKGRFYTVLGPRISASMQRAWSPSIAITGMRLKSCGRSCRSLVRR
jgi:hypothetical protein